MASLSQEIVLILCFSCFFVLVAVGIIVLVLIYQKKQLGFFREKEQITARFEQTLLQSQLEIKEQTFRYISQELHDNLGQQASLVKIYLNTLDLRDTVRASEQLEVIRQQMRHLIKDLKALSVGISGEEIGQLGLVEALQKEADRLSRSGCFQVAFSHSGTLDGLAAAKTVILYRMTQEIINNAVKHSGANAIEIRLEAGADAADLCISDNGKGFAIDDALHSATGAGLRNLFQRARLIESELRINSDIYSGTNVSIRVPLTTTTS